MYTHEVAPVIFCDTNCYHRSRLQKCKMTTLDRTINLETDSGQKNENKVQGLFCENVSPFLNVLNTKMFCAKKKKPRGRKRRFYR